MNRAVVNRGPGIYLVTVSRPDRRPMYYVGQSNNVSRRRSQHLNRLRAGDHFNKRMQRCWDQFGPEAFEIEVLERCDVDELNARESWWLNLMVGHRNCLNIARDPEVSARGIRQSAEHIAKRTAATSGDKHYLFGKVMSQEHRDSISVGGRGVRRSKLTRARISAANVGDKNSMHGRVGLLNGKSKAVLATPVGGGTTIRFESACQAHLAGFQQAQISRCCAGACRSHKGFIWRFDTATKTG